MMIRLDRLEEQLLGYLERNVLTKEMAEYTVDLFRLELEKRLQRMVEQNEDHQSELAKLRSERDSHRGEALRVARAIAASGHSPTLLELLAEAENKVAEVETRIEAQRPPDIKASTEGNPDLRLEVDSGSEELASECHTEDEDEASAACQRTGAHSRQARR